MAEERVISVPVGEPAPPGKGRRGRPRRPTRLLLLLGILGPGLIAASAGNDAGGIATYAQDGAGFGYSLLWAMVVITISLAVVQEMCARMGAITQKGRFWLTSGDSGSLLLATEE